LDAVRGSLSTDRSAECPTETDSCLVGVEEFVGVLLQQAGRAEKPYSGCRNVIGWKLQRPEHSAAIEERPSHMADAFDPHTIREASKMGCRRLVEGTNKVRALIRDRQARARVPNDLEELLFLGLGVFRNSREGLLDPLRNRSQVGLRHGFEEGWAVINQQTKVFASQGRS
jgi:hypothetical protein